MSQSLLRNGEEIELIISSESSEDEDEITANSTTYQHRVNVRSIGDLINQAKHLLSEAETKSQPEPYKSEPAYTYKFSARVKASDLFHESEMAELLRIVSTLKSRLSAERIFSLGCPHFDQERVIFDELLMRFSHELLENSLPYGENNNAEELIRIEGPPNAGNHQPVLDTGPSTSHHIPGTSVTSREILPEIITDEKKSFFQLIIKFLDNLKEFTELTSLDPKVFEEKFQDDNLVIVLKAVHRSLYALLDMKLLRSPIHTPYTSPRRKKRKRSVEDSNFNDSKIIKDEKEENDDEEDSCSVCLEPWSTGGEHRVTCLKCGHLFGLSCILKWVEQAHCCPQCKAPAKKSDLRNIFVRKITAEDTSERDRAYRLLEEEKAARRVLEQKEAQARHKLDSQNTEYEILQNELKQLKAQISLSGGPIPTTSTSTQNSFINVSTSHSSSNKKYQPIQRINIAPQDANCRVFDYCRELGIAVVSQKSPNALFRGFGIKMLSRDFKPLSYQPLHAAAIRDICFRPASHDGQLLSCGMDKSIQLSSVTSKVVIQKYNVNSSVWCCVWNTANTNIFYAGMEKGLVMEFDIRRTDSHVQEILNNGGSPISSLQFVGASGGQLGLQGLLIAQLQNLIFKEQVNDSFTTHILPHLQAPLMSLSLHTSGHFLTSFRPGVNLTKCRYEICHLSQTDSEGEGRLLSSSRQAVWDGGSMQAVISRNALFSRPESENHELMAVTANHSSNTVNVWDNSKKKELQALTCYDKAIDIKQISQELLGVLTEKDLVLYKWR